jgi:hypothetical protein
VKSFLAAVAVTVFLSGCFGYHIGPIKPYYLREVHSIAVPTFRNATFIPRVETLLTSTVIKQLQQDGTYRVTNEEKADAILRATVQSIGRSPARSVRGNVLATTEFVVVITVGYTLEGRDGKAIAGPASISGATSYFVGSDVTTDERQALPIATEDLATRLVSQLSEGW